MQFEEHEGSEACRQAATKNLETTLEGDRWMAVFFQLQDDGKIRVMKTTCHFPHDRYRQSLEILYRLLHNDVKLAEKAAQVEPLPLARHLQNGDETPTEEEHADETDPVV